MQQGVDSSATRLFDKHCLFLCVSGVHTAAQLDEVLRYKPEGRGFVS